MTYSLGKKSQAELVGVHPDLVKVVTRAISVSLQDFSIGEGVRTIQRQRELYAQGRTKPGRIVTGTMKSRHITGHAVDLWPWPKLPNGNVDWNNTTAFLRIGKAMLGASIELGIPVRWGYDWDNDGILQEPGEYDGPHFELAARRYP